MKLNRKRVAVCLKTALHVFDISDMKCLRTLETAPNPDGVMALSPNEDNCHLAFPDGVKGASSGGGSRGEVSVKVNHFSASNVDPFPLLVVRKRGQTLLVKYITK